MKMGKSENLKLQLNETQYDAVKAALKKRTNAHHARVAWFGPYFLEGNSLSIHPMDLVSVLNHCPRTPEIEMELFRLRKASFRNSKNGRAVREAMAGA